MEMPGDERRLDIRPAQFTANRPRCRTLPNRVLDIYDRRHQGDETQIALDHRQQRTDPSAVTGREYTKFTRAAFAQCTHQLPQFRHTLAQPFGVANQIAGNRKLAVPVPARDTGIMIWQMNQACVPTKFVEALCATSITID